MPALTSDFAASFVVDSAASLTTGSDTISTNLAAELLSTEVDKILVDDAGLAEPKGTLAIEDEIIYYNLYRRDESGCMLDLLRGQQGTTPATHALGTAVLIVGAPRFSNPALVESMITVQEVLASGTGATGSFTTADAKTVTVVDGIITSIV